MPVSIWLSPWLTGASLTRRSCTIRRDWRASPTKQGYITALGLALANRGRLDEASIHYRRALEIQPRNAEAHYQLGMVLAGQGRLDEALANYQKALEIQPQDALAHYDLGKVLAARSRFAEAAAHYRQAVELQPRYAMAHGALAWLLATSPEASRRNGAEAIEHAKRADQLYGGQPAILDTLAAAYAEAGRFPEAVTAARKALKLATQQHNQVLANAVQTRIALYEAGKPYRQTLPASAPPPKP